MVPCYATKFSNNEDNTDEDLMVAERERVTGVLETPEE